MTAILSISMTDRRTALARRVVEEGRFPSAPAVLRQALEAKRREDEEWKAGFHETMRRRAQGLFGSMEPFHSWIDRMTAEKRQALGLDR